MSTTENEGPARAEAEQPGTRRAGRKEWLGLAALVLPTLIVSMDLVVLILATPALAADLQPSGTQLLWITDIYGFLIAGSLITMGTLGDRIGRRRLLLIGAAACGLASLLAAFASSPELLILARAVLGVAGATLMPSTLSLLRSLFVDPAQRTVAIGLWVTAFSAGTVIGPVIAGIMLEHFWWGSVFLVNLPVMVLLLLVGPFLLPETHDPRPGRFDLPSAALSLIAVLAVIYGIKRIAEHGIGAAPVVAIVAGIALGAVFVRRQQRLTHPLMDLQLFHSAAFSISVAVNVMIGVMMAGVFLFVAQYLLLVVGLDTLQAGLWLVPCAVGIIVASMLATVAVRRIPAVYLVSGGLAVGAVGLAVIAQVGPEPNLALVITGTVILGLGAAPATTLSTDLIVGAAPVERAGSASAISETGGELGNALGIAVLGSIGIAVYRSAMDSPVPAGVSPESAAAVRETLGGAMEVANRLPAPLGADLVTRAQEAFVSGLQLSAGLGAGVALIAAVLVPALLRGRT